MPAGTTFKQCGCRDGSRKQLGKKCPRLRRPGGGWSPGHGRWYYHCPSPGSSAAPSAAGTTLP